MITQHVCVTFFVAAFSWRPNGFSCSRCDAFVAAVDRGVSWGQLRGLASSSHSVQKPNRISHCNTMNSLASIWCWNIKVLPACKAVVLHLWLEIRWGIMGYILWCVQGSVSELPKCNVNVWNLMPFSGSSTVNYITDQQHSRQNDTSLFCACVSQGQHSWVVVWWPLTQWLQCVLFAVRISLWLKTSYLNQYDTINSNRMKAETNI